jgi:two-component system, chemotaxis family, response regulator PixH
MAMILIVEDTMTQAEAIGGTLRKNGHQTVVVANSDDAKTQLQTLKPDAIILDVVLPGLSGFELCRELKDNPATSNIPIVFCSTKDSEMDRFWGMKQGATSYITKPVDPEELVRTVQLVLPR